MYVLQGDNFTHRVVVPLLIVRQYKNVPISIAMDDKGVISDGNERNGVYKSYHVFPNYLTTFVYKWMRLIRNPGFNLLGDAPEVSTTGTESREANEGLGLEYACSLVSYRDRRIDRITLFG